MTNSEHLDKAVEIHKVLANRKRLEIICTLGKEERSVDDLSRTLKISSANVSQHLSHLRYVRLVRTRRQGTKIFYRLADVSILNLGEEFRLYLKRAA